jgi:hypothetical protein
MVASFARYIPVRPSWFDPVLIILGILHIIFSLLLVADHFLTGVHTKTVTNLFRSSSSAFKKKLAEREDAKLVFDPFNHFLFYFIWTDVVTKRNRCVVSVRLFSYQGGQSCIRGLNFVGRGCRARQRG